MLKYVTHFANCQHLFDEIISTNEINFKYLMNLIHRLHGALESFIHSFRRVNDFCGFRGWHFRPLTSAAEALSNLVTANCAVTACSGSKQASRFGMA